MTRLRFIALLYGWFLLLVVEAAGNEPASPAAKAGGNRPVEKVPTKIAGAYRGGDLIELRVRGRIAYLVKPTGVLGDCPQNPRFGCAAAT